MDQPMVTVGIRTVAVEKAMVFLLHTLGYVAPFYHSYYGPMVVSPLPGVLIQPDSHILGIISAGTCVCVPEQCVDVLCTYRHIYIHSAMVMVNTWCSSIP